MRHMKFKFFTWMFLSLVVVSGCDFLKGAKSVEYYLSFEPVEGIVIEKMGKPSTPRIEESQDRPLDYRLEREDYTLYIKHYDWNYDHTQYTLSAIANNGEELVIDYAIPRIEWPKDDNGFTMAIYCYGFLPTSADEFRRKQLGIPNDNVRILTWYNLDRSLKCEGGARGAQLNRIDLSLFSNDGNLVAQEFLPVKNIANGFTMGH